MRRPSFASGLAALALAVTSLLPGTGLSHADASVCGSLSLRSGASVPGSELQDVTFVSAREAWAVGYARQVGGSYQPLARRWDGTQWSLALPTEFTGDSYLIGVDTLADGSAWAVGFQSAAGGTRRTLIEHAVGGTWTRVASPNDGNATADNTLMSISGTAATGLWAVGYRASPTGLKALVLRYDTSLPSPSWVSVGSAGGVPSPGKVETVLTGVR